MCLGEVLELQRCSCFTSEGVPALGVGVFEEDENVWGICLSSIGPIKSFGRRMTYVLLLETYGYILCERRKLDGRNARAKAAVE